MADGELITLDVRGQTIKTFKSTLEKAEYFKGYLARWTKSLNEPIFLDVDPEYFRQVLNKLSNEMYSLPDDNNIIQLYTYFTGVTPITPLLKVIRHEEINYNKQSTFLPQGVQLLSITMHLYISDNLYYLSVFTVVISSTGVVILDVPASLIFTLFDKVYTYMKTADKIIMSMKPQYLEILNSALMQYDVRLELSTKNYIVQCVYEAECSTK